MTLAVAIVVSGASLVLMFRIHRDATTLTRMHYEHPDRPGEAWCGAEVVGVRGPNLGPVNCVVCADLRAARRRHS